MGDGLFLAKFPSSNSECAIAPVDLPVGRSVTGLELLYANFNAAVQSMDVRLRGTRLVAGSWVFDVITDTTVGFAQGGGTTSWASQAATITGGAPAKANHAYQLELCSTGQVDFAGMVITLG